MLRDNQQRVLNIGLCGIDVTIAASLVNRAIEELCDHTIIARAYLLLFLEQMTNRINESVMCGPKPEGS